MQTIVVDQRRMPGQWQYFLCDGVRHLQSSVRQEKWDVGGLWDLGLLVGHQPMQVTFLGYAMVSSQPELL